MRHSVIGDEMIQFSLEFRFFIVFLYLKLIKKKFQDHQYLIEREG